MKTLILTIATTALLLPALVSAGDIDLTYSILNGRAPIIQLKKKHEQAQAWATCSVVFGAAATLLKETRPAQAKNLWQADKDAQRATLIVNLLGGMDWALAKEQVDLQRKDAAQKVLSNLNLFKETDMILYVKKVSATLFVCNKNVKDMQKLVE